MQVNITLPETLQFRRAGHDMEVPLSALPPQIIADLVAHGIVQTVGDAASAASGVAYDAQKGKNENPWKDLTPAQKNAFTESHATDIAKVGHALMAKRWESLASGEWKAPRAATAGLSTLEERIADIIAGKMTFDKGVRKPEKIKAAWEVFETMTGETSDKVRKLAQAQLDREAADRRALAELDIDLTDF